MREHRLVHHRRRRSLGRRHRRPARSLAIAGAVQFILLPPAARCAVIRHAPPHRRPPTMLLTAAERTSRRRQVQIPRIRQKEDAALRASHPTPPHIRMRTQRRPQRRIVPQGDGLRRLRSIPAGTKLEMPLKFYCVKASVWLTMLIVFCMAPSYPSGSTTSRGYDGVSSSPPAPTAYCLETKRPAQHRRRRAIPLSK